VIATSFSLPGNAHARVAEAVAGASGRLALGIEGAPRGGAGVGSGFLASEVAAAVGVAAAGLVLVRASGGLGAADSEAVAGEGGAAVLSANGLAAVAVEGARGATAALDLVLAGEAAAGLASAILVRLADGVVVRARRGGLRAADSKAVAGEGGAAVLGANGRAAVAIEPACGATAALNLVLAGEAAAGLASALLVRFAEGVVVRALLDALRAALAEWSLDGLSLGAVGGAASDDGAVGEALNLAANGAAFALGGEELLVGSAGEGKAVDEGAVGEALNLAANGAAFALGGEELLVECAGGGKARHSGAVHGLLGLASRAAFAGKEDLLLVEAALGKRAKDGEFGRAARGLDPARGAALASGDEDLLVGRAGGNQALHSGAIGARTALLAAAVLGREELLITLAGYPGTENDPAVEAGASGPGVHGCGGRGGRAKGDRGNNREEPHGSREGARMEADAGETETLLSRTERGRSATKWQGSQVALSG
jgi:hypothetical protein